MQAFIKSFKPGSETDSLAWHSFQSIKDRGDGVNY